MKNKLKAKGYRIVKLALICCALFIFSVLGVVAVLSPANATSLITIDTTPGVTPTPPTPVPPTATPVTPTPTTIPPTPVPTTIPPTPVPTTPPIIVKPTPIPPRRPTPIPTTAATSGASLTATAVASPTAGTATPTSTVGVSASPTAVATQQAITAADHTAPPTDPAGGNGTPNIALSVTIGLVLLLIVGSLGGLVMLRKRGIPILGLAGIGASEQKAPSIPWSRNKKIEPAFDNGGASILQAGAFAANGSAWSPLNNTPPMATSAATAFAAASGVYPLNASGVYPLNASGTHPLNASGVYPLNSQAPMPNANQTYTPSALRPITTSLPVEYPHSRPLNTTQTSDMRPLSMDALDFSSVLNEQAATNQLRPTAADAVQLALPGTAPLPVPPRNTPAPASRLATGPVAIPSQTPQSGRHATPAPPPATPALQESQPNSDAMLETIMRQAQMGLYVLPDKQTPNRGDSNH